MGAQAGRVLRLLLSDPKAGWGHPPRNGPKPSKQTDPCQIMSYDGVAGDTTTSPPREVSCNAGFERCQLSYQHKRTSQEVPTFPCRPPSVPIQCLTLQIFHCPKGFYQMYASSNFPSEDKRRCYLPILGRLAYDIQGPRRVTFLDPVCSDCPPRPENPSQLEKFPPGTRVRYHLYRGSVEHDIPKGILTRRKVQLHQRSGAGLPTTSHTASSVDTATAQPYGILQYSDTLRTSENVETTTMVTVSFPSQQRQSAGTSGAATTNSTITVMVVRQPESPRGSPAPDAISISLADDRRTIARVGCPL
ncbi:uncharacterized protein LOC128344932 [Hemicordylus capensis]|uniref:uncharacterized protein LOC128344932 n=1 Tax=Hemicordylus capensis TaxID=884348 RepID=UPI002303D921|nr:uncharacterized protein LOC128344932 [Hemicordylus capensis]